MENKIYISKKHIIAFGKYVDFVGSWIYLQDMGIVNIKEKAEDIIEKYYLASTYDFISFIREGR